MFVGFVVWSNLCAMSVSRSEFPLARCPYRQPRHQDDSRCCSTVRRPLFWIAANGQLQRLFFRVRFSFVTYMNDPSEVVFGAHFEAGDATVESLEELKIFSFALSMCTT